MSTDPAAPAVSGSEVRESNTARLVALLRSRGPMTRAELVRASGLARPTVLAIASTLMRTGVVLEAGTRAPADLPAQRGGRPGTVLRFNGAVSTVVGAQVHRGGATLRQVSAEGQPIAESLIEVGDGDARELAELLGAGVEQLAGTSAAPAALGLSLPGFIHHGTVTRPAQGWHEEPVQELLQERLGIPVTLTGPATAATAGERSAGVARDHDDVVLVFYARGIGAGVLSAGRLLRGSGGAIGELGH